MNAVSNLMHRLVLMWDSSISLPFYPQWLKIVAGYIGGDTPHIWTPEEWRRAGRRKKLPIFVNDKSTPNNAFTDAFFILEQAFLLGIPVGSPIAIDMETSVDTMYVQGLARILHWFGYKLWVYGSSGFVFSNPQCDGYWVATLSDVRKMYPHKGVVATQWRNAGRYDSSLVKWWQYVWVLKTW